jgi:hypothetical protein
MKIRYSGRKSPIAKVIHFSSKKWVQLRDCESKFEYACLPRLEFDPTITYYEALPDPYAYEHSDSRVMPDTSDECVVEQGDYPYSEEVKPYELCAKSFVYRNCAITLSHIDNSDRDFHIVAEQGVYVDDVIPNYRRHYQFFGELLPAEYLARLGELLPSFCCSLLELRRRLEARGSYMLKHPAALSVVEYFSLEIDFSYEDVNCFQLLVASDAGGAL